jgi:hypothetical protein
VRGAIRGGEGATGEGRRGVKATKKCSSGLLAMGSVMFGARGRSSEDAIDGVWGAGTRWNSRNERGIKEGE